MTDGALAKKLEKLRVSYLHRMPDELEAIEATAEVLASVSTPEARRKAVESLQMMSHKLAGSGAVFGFEAMGDAARLVEQATTTALDANASPIEISSGIADELIEQLRAAISSAPPIV